MPQPSRGDAFKQSLKEAIQRGQQQAQQQLQQRAQQQAEQRTLNPSMPTGAAGKVLGKTLVTGEQVLSFASGSLGTMLVATDRRAIIIKTGFAIGMGNRECDSYGYQQITSIEIRTKLSGSGFVEISTGGVQNIQRNRGSQKQAQNTVPFSLVSAAAIQRTVAVIREHLYGAPTAASQAPIQAPAAQDTAQDIPAQIASLAQLHDQGILTDAEFAEKKAELLKRM